MCIGISVAVISMIYLLYLSWVQSNMTMKAFFWAIVFLHILGFPLIPGSDKITAYRVIDGSTYCGGYLMSSSQKSMGLVHDSLMNEINSTGTLVIVWGFSKFVEPNGFLWSL